MERKTLSIESARALVGVSRRTIYNWMESGKIEYRRTPGGNVRIYADTLWRDANDPSLDSAPPNREPLTNWSRPAGE